MKNDNILITVTPEIESFIRLNRFILTNTKRAIYFWAAPAVFFFMGIIMALTGDKLGGVIFIIMSPLCVSFMLSLNALLIRKNFKSSKFNSEIKEITYILNDKGIEMKTQVASRDFTWEHINMIYDTNYSFYIMQDNSQSIIIDKKFITEEQAAIIKAMAEEKLGEDRYICKINKNKAIKHLE